MTSFTQCPLKLAQTLDLTKKGKKNTPFETYRHMRNKLNTLLKHNYTSAPGEEILHSLLST